jgi:hypothetical protein
LTFLATSLLAKPTTSTILSIFLELTSGEFRMAIIEPLDKESNANSDSLLIALIDFSGLLSND